jgi:hypothetical protein
MNFSLFSGKVLNLNAGGDEYNDQPVEVTG